MNAKSELLEGTGVATVNGIVVNESEAKQMEIVAKHVQAILSELGLDTSDPNLVDTDRRVAQMYFEMFHGLREGAEPAVTCFPNEEGFFGVRAGMYRVEITSPSIKIGKKYNEETTLGVEVSPFTNPFEDPGGIRFRVGK